MADLTPERLEELFERCREDSNEVWPIIYPAGLYERVVAEMSHPTDK